jgi:hypothetical protein
MPVIVTDDLAAYKTVAEELGLAHQICQLEVRCWVGLSVHELKETIPEEWICMG